MEGSSEEEGQRDDGHATTHTNNRERVREVKCLSSTIKPRRAANSGVSEKVGKAKAEEAVNAAVDDLRDVAMPAWHAQGLCRNAIATKEFGKGKGGAHIQFGSEELTLLSLSETVKQLKARLLSRLKRHDAGGIIVWSIREVHEHDDTRLLAGYCFKEHVKFPAISLLRYAVVGERFTVAYLKDAFKYWLSRAPQNEFSDASLNILRPGQHAGTHTITRTSLLGDVEYFKHERGLAPLRLTVGKLTSFMISEEYAQLHTMFASGVGASGGQPHPVLQNLWLAVRERPRIGGSVSIINKLLYGPAYDTATDSLIDDALDGAMEGPDTTVTNSLSYAECILAVRRGELPDGTPLQTRLVGYVARAYIVSLGGAEGAAHDCSRMLSTMGMLVNEHISSVGLHAVGERVAALAARLLATTATPFSLTPTEITVRLTHPEVLSVLDGMLLRLPTSSPTLSEDEMLSAVTAIPPDEARTEHPWLMSPVHINTLFREDVVMYSALQGIIQTSISTYELGPPTVHVCIVETAAQYFVCAWQLTLQRMRALEVSRPLQGAGGASPAATTGAMPPMQTEGVHNASGASGAAGASAQAALARARAAAADIARAPTW
jgi:hypothetical protein